MFQWHTEMSAHMVGWLLFLALITNISCGTQDYFRLEDGNRNMAAEEGSCVEIKCIVSHRVTSDVPALWFWIKNPQWRDNKWIGTVIYSTDNTLRSVSPDFAGRVKYIGSPPSSWANERTSSAKCSILICDLKTSDSGVYAFRFEGNILWITKPGVNITVFKNPCPITFVVKPPIVVESGTITLTCSTSTSCHSKPIIQAWTQPPGPLQQPQKQETTTFSVSWQDDGKVFSCQTQNNKDKYLIQNISISVEYAPREILAASPANIVERQSVTLTCSAKGKPPPTFRWIKKYSGEEMTSNEVWEITSVKESQNGEYYCEAKNKHGTIKSSSVFLTVTYVPEVELTSSASVVKQGNKMTLTCNVKRSNPRPHVYSWFKNGNVIAQEQRHQYVVQRIKPEDGGLYTCNATNTVGVGTSRPLQIQVEYGPRKTNISMSKDGKEMPLLVDVGNSVTFYCFTDANPASLSYSWYRFSFTEQSDPSQWKSKTTHGEELFLNSVQRADAACYRCNATNSINTGEDSEPVCLQVLYAPTEPTLSMDTEVREGQRITIRCTVESSPLSKLTLRRTSTSNSLSSEWHFPQTDNIEPNNTLQHTFIVMSTHTGFYTCSATNSKGSKTSVQRRLEVKYHPKDVTVDAEPDFVVDENKSLTLHCHAHSHPPVTSVTWMKTTDGKSEIIWKKQTFTLKSASPSDSGLYSCSARNEFGTGNSEQAEVKVKYAPKHASIMRVAEHHHPGGMSSVTLSCRSVSYPPITQYSWYKKADGRDENVSNRQNYTVYSDQPGVYYCTAKNEINQALSDPVHLFDRHMIKALVIFLGLIVLLIIILIIFVYRHKKKRSSQAGTTNTLPCFGFLGWWNSARRRNLMHDPGTTEPFRSRDDLLPDQRRPNARPCQPPPPDSTPASSISSVYYTVNLPSGKSAPSAPKIIRQQGELTQDDSLNYASLDFGNKQKNTQQKVKEDVYTVVSKKRLPKKTEKGLEDYENVSSAHADKPPDSLNYNSDTSEEEVEISYSQVSFKAKPGHQRRADRDSSNSDEEEMQYSKVKF